MTRDKDRKRIIRNRMKTTGESYTTARRHVVARTAKATGHQDAAPASTPAPLRVLTAAADHAAITGMSDEKIKRQTGRDWNEWVRLLNAEGAAAMTHRDVARLVHDKYSVADWWSQTVTVGYERLTGRRERGQRMNGAYEVSKSKTFGVSAATLFDACVKDTKRRRWLDGIDARVRTATAPKSMRLQWPDGTIVAMWFLGKGDAKTTLALAHTKLPSRSAMEQAKEDWSARLDALGRLLSRKSA